MGEEDRVNNNCVKFSNHVKSTELILYQLKKEGIEFKTMSN